MFAASVCALFMFMWPLFGWRFFNSVGCSAKRRQISMGSMHRLWLFALIGTAAPLVALCVFASGTTVVVGAVAWVVGFVFWMLNH